MADSRPAILSLSRPELEAWLATNEVPLYRGGQILGWLARGAASFEAMLDLPKALRAAPDRDFRITSLRPVAVSQPGGPLTPKTLFRPDGWHSLATVVPPPPDPSPL